MRRVTATACLLALVACGADETSASGPASARDAASCGPVETPPEQGGGHLIGDATPPVSYNSVPPTSGWHTSAPVGTGIRSSADPLTEPEQVSVLEAGGVVVSYHEIPATDVAALAALARTYAGRVAVTPYDALASGQVAMTAYGTVQVCDGLDLSAIRAFVETHAAQPVQPPH